MIHHIGKKIFSLFLVLHPAIEVAAVFVFIVITFTVVDVTATAVVISLSTCSFMGLDFDSAKLCTIIQIYIIQWNPTIMWLTGSIKETTV